MKINETKTAGLVHSFDVVVSASEFEKENKKKLEKVASQSKLPGFRPGKAPLTVIEQKYGQSCRAETAEYFMQEASAEALTKSKLRAAQAPRVDIKTVENGKDFEFSLKIEVLPEIKDVDLSKIELTRLTAEATDKEIGEALDRLARSHTTTEKVDEKRATKKGDIIVIDFVGKMNGEEFRGGKGNDYYLELGSNTFIPGFEDQLTGVEVGADAVVNVKFPENYHAKDLAGKEAVFDVKVKELRSLKKAEINDEFAKIFGQENLEELKKLIKEELTREYAHVSKTHLKRAILDTLVEKCDFEAPASMLEGEFNAIWTQFEKARKNNDIDEEEKKKSDDELKKEYRSISERRVKLGLLLAEIANKNKITLTDDDISKAIAAEAARYPGKEQAVFDFYAKNTRALEGLKAPLFEEKVMDFIISKIKTEDKVLSVEELYAFDPDKK